MKVQGDGPWELPLAGFSVGRLSFGMPLDIYLDHAATRAQIRLSGPFAFGEAAEGVRRLDAETDSWDQLAVLVSLRNDRISRATAWKDARLRVAFQSGRSLSAHSEGQYEDWEVSGPGFKIVGTPGEVTAWDEDTRSTRYTVPAAQRREHGPAT
jgi:hypothetical protein